MTLSQRIQVVMDLIESGIITVDKAVEMLEDSYQDNLAHLPMETVEMDLP